MVHKSHLCIGLLFRYSAQAFSEVKRTNSMLLHKSNFKPFEYENNFALPPQSKQL